jgi:N-ethylmaleimide reductase
MTTNIFTPVTIGDLKLKNRIVMAPLTRGRAGISRTPNDFMREYYTLRASAGLIISEATTISDQGYGWYGAPGIYTQEHCEGWKNVLEGVHSKGGLMVCQLWHMGRKAHSSFHEIPEIVAPSAIPVKTGVIADANRKHSPPEVPRALETHEIPNIVQDYVNAARLAKEAGFDGVEIHAANGYLIDEFLQSVSNHRTDQYGGSYENRYRFLKEIIENVNNIFPFSRIGVRISPNGAFNDMGTEENYDFFRYVAKQLSTYKLAYIHLLDGEWRGFHGKCKAVNCYDIKTEFNGPIIANTAYTKELANGVLRTGAADAVAFGLPFIANPDLVEKFANDLPLNPVPPLDVLFGSTPDPADCLEGYLTFSKK